MKSIDKMEKENIQRKGIFMRKNQSKGITLIALVITIIVLLILAGVSIVSLAGEGSILNKATKAKRETDEARSRRTIKSCHHGSENGLL